MSTAETSDHRSPTAAPVVRRGMRHWQPPLIAERATTDAASSRLFGEAYVEITDGSHRGEILRFMLRALYGANYRQRGARLFGISPQALSDMFRTGQRISRRKVERLESALASRERHRRGELRGVAASVEAGFTIELGALSRCRELMPRLSRAASEAANTRQPHSRETGRFVSRVQGKVPDLSERPKKNRS